MTKYKHNTSGNRHQGDHNEHTKMYIKKKYGTKTNIIMMLVLKNAKTVRRQTPETA